MRLGNSCTSFQNTGVWAALSQSAASTLQYPKAVFSLNLDLQKHKYVIAVDIPSGINSDTGELTGAGIHADTTITFGMNKTGLIQGDGKEYAGEIIVEDIGIPGEAYDHVLS